MVRAGRFPCHTFRHCNHQLDSNSAPRTWRSGLVSRFRSRGSAHHQFVLPYQSWPPALSKALADRIGTWENAGDIVTMVDNLSQDETSTLLGFSRKHFGECVAEAGTTPKGKTWTVKLWRVGSQILPARLEEGRPLFKVILYRRDLASQKGIRRPWRTIYREDSTLKQVKPGPLIELPNWIAD